jgi:flagellar motor protein MotB
MDEETLDFNFWPSFADLMLILVLILVITVFAVIAVISAEMVDDGTDDLNHVREKQRAMIEAVAKGYGVEPKHKKDGSFVIEEGRTTEIVIRNEPTLQRFSFKDRILFEPDEYLLKQAGKETLLIVGNEIKNNLFHIREIQIQGHADPDTPSLSPSNLHLAAWRAIEVFNFLQDQVKIDPASHLMSATSFGEFKPVQRPDQDSTYHAGKLKRHNKTKELKAQNRRIEILLFYRYEKTE